LTADSGFDPQDLQPPKELPEDANELARVLALDASSPVLSGGKTSRGAVLEQQIRAKLSELKTQAKSASDRCTATQKLVSTCNGQLRMIDENLAEVDRQVCARFTARTLVRVGSAIFCLFCADRNPSRALSGWFGA
jgi:hypothetical protein